MSHCKLKSILGACLLVITGMWQLQAQYQLVGQWQAQSSEFGVFYQFDWTFKADQGAQLTRNNGHQRQQASVQWNYQAPVLLLQQSGNTVFKANLTWKDANAFTLKVLESANQDEVGVVRSFTRQQEVILSSHTGRMPTQVSRPGATCYACFGSGRADCGSCGGAGGYQERVPYNRYNPTTGYTETDYQNEWRACTAMGCNDGKVNCTACGQRDVQRSATYGEVPTPAGIAGSWKSGSSIYTFQIGSGYRDNSLEIVEGIHRIYGIWSIEDGYLKIRLYTGGNSTWQKYRFTSFDYNNLYLQNSEAFTSLYLQRLKN